MSNGRRTRAGLLAILMEVLLASLPVSGATDGGRRTPEDVVWEYLDTQFTRASADPTYWKRRWNLEIDVTRRDVCLGKPFARYRLGVPELETFIASGDLLGSAFLTDVSYPVFLKHELIGTIMIVEEEGQWSFAGRALRGSRVDSLATAHGEKGDSVAIVGGRGVGAYMLIIRPGASETRLYPIQGSLVALHADEDGTLDYGVACALLVPEAARWLAEHRRSEEQRLQKQDSTKTE